MAYLKKIFLIGGGGHSNSIYDLIESTKKYKIIGFVDLKNDNQFLSSKCQYLGSDEVIEDLIKDYQNTVICIGQIKNSIKRIKIFNKLIKLKANLPVIISPFGYVSNSAKIDVGTVIMHGAVINSNSSIGKNCIINSQSLIEHDVKIGNHNHISTGAKINGGVEIGNQVFIGSGSIIKQGIKIGSKNLIPAGSVVMKDLPNK